MFTHSIRWRLQLWLGFLLICVLSGFGVTVHQLQRANQFKQLDEDLKQRVAALSAAVRGRFGWDRPPDGPRRPEPPGFEDEFRPPPREGGGGHGPPPWPWGRGEGRFGRRELRVTGVNLFDQANTNSFYFAAWSREGTPMGLSTNAPAGIPKPEWVNDTLTHTRMREGYREAFHYTELGDCVLAGRSIKSDLEAMSRFTGWMLAAGAAVLALGLGGGWWLTTRAIRPVEDISAAASRISAGNLSERITTSGPENELGRLVGVLNSTFARLEAAFAQQKQFTADASHELRTPLAVIISEAQTALSRDRSAAEYRETVEGCLETAQQMRRLTESLLDLARFEGGQDQRPRQPVDMAESARISLQRVRPLALKHGITIESDLESAICSSHADRLIQVMTNLLGNAVHYNKPNGHVQITTCSEKDQAILRVVDTGIGIGPEDQPHIFARFYRADKARSRSEGRSGLGLAICKAMVEADGGSIEVISQLGVGTTFVVKLKVWR